MVEAILVDQPPISLAGNSACSKILSKKDKGAWPSARDLKFQAIVGLGILLCSRLILRWQERTNELIAEKSSVLASQGKEEAASKKDTRNKICLAKRKKR